MARRWQPDGSLAIVTGASSGVGREFCKLLAQRGCRIIIVARREQRLQELQSAYGDQYLFPIVGDVTEPAVREQAIALAEQLGDGRLDLLVNNAGIGAMGAFAEASEERLRRIMEVNFFAPTSWTRDCIPLLRQGKSPVVCNVGSVLGHRAVPNKSEYCASKFALHGWTDAVRAELNSAGIQFTLISPSTTESEFFSALIETENDQKSVSFGSWSPQKVARTMLAAISARRSEVICSLGGKALVYTDRLAPPLVNAVLARTARPPSRS